MRALPFVFMAGCASAVGPVGVDPGEAGGSDTTPTGSGSGSGSSSVAIIPDVRCAGTPDVGPAGDFRHFESGLISAAGSPKHRGFDLIASADANPQTLEGWISYSVLDKALEDEDVDVYACRQQAWEKLGTARTDAEGHFALALDGGSRLPIAMRDLYLSVVGDRTGAEFLGYVAPAGTKLAITDVDGTLTASENAFLESIVSGAGVDAQDGAAVAYGKLAARHVQPVYLTARGNQNTDATRSWLADQGFPRGPLRLSPSFLTVPGADTIAFKTDALAPLSPFDLFAGIGNRDTDVQAYAAAGIATARTFVKLPEYADELQSDLAAGSAVAIDTYAQLQTSFIDLLPP